MNASLSLNLRSNEKIIGKNIIFHRKNTKNKTKQKLKQKKRGKTKQSLSMVCFYCLFSNIKWNWSHTVANLIWGIATDLNHRHVSQTRQKCHFVFIVNGDTSHVCRRRRVSPQRKRWRWQRQVRVLQMRRGLWEAAGGTLQREAELFRSTASLRQTWILRVFPRSHGNENSQILLRSGEWDGWITMASINLAIFKT